MKQNTKFLWLYTAILFSVALVLIFIAGLTQNNYKKELDAHETANRGMQESVTQLTAHNQQLTDQLKEANAQLEEVRAQLEELQRQQAEQSHASAAIDQTLLEAIELYDNGDRQEARQRLEGMDRATLTPAQAYLYDQINP